MRWNLFKKRITILLVLLSVFAVNAAEIWVSPKGNDTNEGAKGISTKDPVGACKIDCNWSPVQWMEAGS